MRLFPFYNCSYPLYSCQLMVMYYTYTQTIFELCVSSSQVRVRD